MKIKSSFISGFLPTSTTGKATQTDRASSTSPGSRTPPSANATGAREKLGGYRASTVAAGLRMFHEPSVKNATAFVKSAVAKLSDSIKKASSAGKGRPSQVAPEPERQAPQRRTAQDPRFGSANAPAARTPGHPAMTTALPAATQARQERPTVSFRTRSAPPQRAPVSVRTPAQPTFTPVHTQPPQAKVFTNHAAFVKASDQWLRNNNFDYDNPMPAGHVHEPRPEFRAPSPAPARAARTEPQGQVFTNRAAYAKAYDQWERNNNFDYDNPMPAGHVYEPPPEFRSTHAGVSRQPQPSAAELRAQREAEINAEQEARDNGY